MGGTLPPAKSALHRLAPAVAAALTVLMLGLALAVPGAALAAAGTTTLTATRTSNPTTLTATRASNPNTPVLVTSPSTPPAGYRLTALEVLAVARRAPVIRDELRRHPHAKPYEYTKGPGRWQVSWFSAGRHAKELAQVYVSDLTGRVTEAWTGFQVAWAMARGYPGAFGRKVTALYVWLPLAALFFLAFVPRPRRWRRGGPGWSLLHLDLAVLLALSVSLAFFDHARIGISVPLVYPCLLYLMGRALALAFGRGIPRRPLPLLVPAPWLLVAVVFLAGFRVGLNVANSNVIDVGYAGVIGADKVIHGQHLYGGWPTDNPQGDTYGPVNYLAYVPFRAIFGWSGSWDNLPAAHAAAIAFDLLTLLGLFLLGRSIRGPTLGVALAYAWVAYPFTAYALESNSNDSLVAMLIVAALLLLRWAPARGAAAALAGLAKFAPLALGPLFLRGSGPPPRPRTVFAYVLAYAVTGVVVMLPVLLHGNTAAFWHDTIVYQSTRPAPFSIWGLWGGLRPEQRLVQGATIALALGAMLVPRLRSALTVAALAAAILILLQLGLTYWFYLYIPWFFAPLAVALLGAHPEGIPMPDLDEPPPPERRLPLPDPGAPAMRMLSARPSRAG